MKSGFRDYGVLSEMHPNGCEVGSTMQNDSEHFSPDGLRIT